MSRRRKNQTPVPSSTAPNDSSPLGHLSDAQLFKELARRRVARGKVDLAAIESYAAEAQREMGQETLGAVLAAMPAEDGKPKPCPKCGRPTPVKARNRPRHVLTIAGELRFTRNYHHCEDCKCGFYPRDRELNLPEKGEVSDAMERRILDFGVNDPFGVAAERWAIHYPTTISSNLFRRVVDRVAQRQDDAWSPLTLQHAYRPVAADDVPRSLVIATDGGMLLTREGGWREAKVAVVARGEDFLDVKSRRSVANARYVAEFGHGDFKKELSSALDAEHVDEVGKVVWLGDGAHENWRLADELAPFSIQILDLPHAIQNAMTCAKVLLGEGDATLPLWGARMKTLLDNSSPDVAIRELVECIEYAESEEQLGALDDLVRYYRTNEKRMRYRAFREQGLPIGSGIVESAHRHVLQCRMKRSGQRWSLKRARRMARLRAGYRTAGPLRFHAAIRAALAEPPKPEHHYVQLVPLRVKQSSKLSRVSPLNRKELARRALAASS